MVRLKKVYLAGPEVSYTSGGCIFLAMTAPPWFFDRLEGGVW